MTRFERLLVTAEGATSVFGRGYLLMLWLLGVALPWYAATTLIRAEPANLILAFLGAMIGAAKAVSFAQGQISRAKRRYWAERQAQPEREPCTDPR